MAGTTLRYAGIELRNVLTREFDQVPIRDSTGTDQLYYQFSIRVETIVNADLLLQSNPLLGTIPQGLFTSDTAWGVATAVRKFLGEDRKELSYEMDGVQILKSNALVDCDNGPKVSHLNVTRVSPKTLTIEFGIVAALVECEMFTPNQGRPDRPGSPTLILNNRWSSADDMDEHFRTIRTWRGKLRLASAVKSPHDFRGVVIPVLNRGFKRRRMNFVGEANALELGYEIVDEEMLGEAPPSPAIKMAGMHIESVGIDGVTGIGECIVRLEGHKKSDKREMIQRAAQIVNAKLQVFRRIAGKGTKQILNYTLVDHFGDSENAVEARAQIRHTADAKTETLGAVVTAKIGKMLRLELPDYDDQKAEAPDAYGTASVAGLFACYLQSPCSPRHGMPSSYDPEPEEEDEDSEGDRSGTEIFYSTGPVSSDFDPPPYSSEHLSSVYTFYQIDTIVLKKYNRVQLPIAASSESNSSGDTCKVIDLAQPTAQLRVQIAAERMGSWPQILKDGDFESDNGISHSILDFQPNFRSPKFTGDGRSMLFAIDAIYLWAMSRAPATGEELKISNLPWDDSEPHIVPGEVYSGFPGIKSS